MANRVLNLNFVKNSSIVQLDEKSIANGTLGGLVVFDAEALFLNTEHLGAESINTGISGGGISASGLSMTHREKGVEKRASFQRSVLQR